MTRICCLLSTTFILLASAGADDKLFERSELKALAKEKPEAQIYRLFIHRSFDSPLLFELEIYPSGAGALYTKKARMELSEDGELEATRIIKSSRVDVDDNPIVNFLMLMEYSDVWKLPEEDWTETTKIDGRPIGESLKDGSLWIFEAVSEGKYHRIERRSPTSGDILWPEDMRKNRDALRVSREGVLLAAWMWMITYGGESHERLY